MRGQEEIRGREAGEVQRREAEGGHADDICKVMQKAGNISFRLYPIF